MEALSEGDLRIRAPQAAVRRLLAAAWGINAFLLVINLALAAGWRPRIHTIAVQLNMDNEVCVAAWYSSFLLMLVGAAAALQLIVRGRGGEMPRASRIGWLMVAGLALFLSADEVSVIHETIGGSFATHVGGTLFGMRVVWTEVMAPFILGAALFLALFLWRELRGTPGARALVWVALGCWLGAVAMESATYLLRGMPIIGVFEPAVEETLENVGTTLLLTGFLQHALSRGKVKAVPA
ncbi:MAG: hypothetical protein HY321_14150 [Armatimonadetes bacterium]|nr:hypothetical protein [Armatimonadota bacterium]